MRLSKKDLKALAREARKLAYEIAEERGPRMDPGSWCNCAMGHVVERSGVRVENHYRPYASEIAATTMMLDDHATYVLGLASEMYSISLVGEALHSHGAEGTVFPLLQWADALENAAEPPSRDSAVLEEL